jgi:iron complex transport system permease protein
MRGPVLVAALLLIAPLCLAAGLLAGETSLAPSSLRVLLGGADGSIQSEILLHLRLPRVLSAFACGGLLAIAGALLQVLLRNPLADPYVLGISGGASVAVLSAWLLGISAVSSGAAALLGALAALSLTLILGWRARGFAMDRLLLTGVVLASGFGAMVSLLLSLAPSARLPGMVFFLLGDLSVAEDPVAVWAVFAGLAAFGLWAAPGLDVLSLGEAKAKSLGIAVGSLQAAAFLAAAAATAVVVVQAGAIGFVGLMIPHAVRLLGVSDHRWLLPACLLLGGSLLTLADLLSRTLVAPAELPVGVITALLGVPALLWLLGKVR